MAFLAPSLLLGGNGGPDALALLDLEQADSVQLTPETFPFDSAAPGTPQNPQPAVAGNELGTPVETFGSDWFGHVHLIRSRAYPSPASIGDLIADFGHVVDLGNILAGQAFDFVLSNQDRPATATHSITSVDITNPTGISVAPSSFPDLLEMFEEAIYTITIDLLGPPALDSVVDWIFAAIPSLPITITGSRVTLWPHKAQVAITESLHHRTDVITARSGLEQRVTARVGPRVQYRMRYFLRGVARSQALNLLFGWGARVFAVPMWHEAQRLGVTLSLGVTVIPVDTRWVDFRDFTPSNLAVLWRSPTDFEIVEILARADAQLTLVRATEQAHTPATQIIPLRLAYIEDTSSAPRQRVELQALDARWLSIDGIDLKRTEDATPITTDTYRGAPVLLDPNFLDRTTLPDVVQQGYERFDPNGAGGFVIFGHRDAPENRTGKIWFVDSLEDKAGLRALLHSFDGRRVGFWLPTFGDDLVLTQPLVDSTAAFSAELTDYARFVGEQSPRRDVVVFRNDGGAPLLRRIIGSADVGGNVEDFTIDSNWGVSLAIADVARVSFLTRVRLDSDRIEIEHRPGFSARLRVGLLEVIDE